jgi:hypothetical protein
MALKKLTMAEIEQIEKESYEDAKTNAFIIKKYYEWKNMVSTRFKEFVSTMITDTLDVFENWDPTMEHVYISKNEMVKWEEKWKQLSHKFTISENKSISHIDELAYYDLARSNRVFNYLDYFSKICYKNNKLEDADYMLDILLAHKRNLVNIIIHHLMIEFENSHIVEIGIDFSDDNRNFTINLTLE